MVNQLSSQTTLVGSEIIYLEGGKLLNGILLSTSECNSRIQTPQGLRRKISNHKLVVNCGEQSAKQIAEQATKLSASIDMDQVWALANQEQLAAIDLVTRLKMAANDNEVVAALYLAQSKEGLYFTFENDRWQPVTDEHRATVKKSYQLRKKRVQKHQEFEKLLDDNILPDELKEVLVDYLALKSDLNNHALRFFKSYCQARNTSFAELAIKHNLITDPEQFHLREVQASIKDACVDIGEIPKFQAKITSLPGKAYSIDAKGTLEIDDAFLCNKIHADSFEISICIAAPALGLAPGELQQALERKVTIYLPNAKHMMLPLGAIQRFSLNANKDCPCVAITYKYDQRQITRNGKFVIANVKMQANLELENFNSHSVIPAGVTKDEITDLNVISDFSHMLQSRPIRNVQRRGHLVSVKDHKPQVIARASFAAADDMVARMMTHYNTDAASYLLSKNVPFIGRIKGRSVVVDDQAKFRPEYGWFSSPLRRVVDLYNQYQLIAAIDNKKIPYSSKDLANALAGFESFFQRGRTQQQKLETYWAIKWLQTKIPFKCTGVFLAETNTVLLDDAPLQVDPNITDLDDGSKVEIEVTLCDPIRLVVQAKVL